METVENGKAALISSIEKDARIEAEKILEDAETHAAERRKYAEKQVQSIEKNVEKKSKHDAETVKNKILSGLDIEIKRKAMSAENIMITDILNRVEKELHTMIDKPEYRAILLNWTVEAVIGLGAESAEVNASREELNYIDKKFLSEVEKKVKSIYEQVVKLKLSNEQPLISQGIILTSADGRTAFNNQISTRLIRKQREIRKLIYETLFNKNIKD